MMQTNNRKNNVMVSVICTAYNQEAYIKDALEGFIMQKTNFHFEIIISDDASTDITASIIKQYEMRYPELFKPFYHIENQYSKGIPFFCNELFANAQGKYIALCEGDDYWTDPLKLQKQVDFLEENPGYSLCFHNAKVIYENTYNKSHIFHNFSNSDFTIKEIIENKWFIPTQSIVFQRKYLDFPKWINYVFGGDYAIQLILATRGNFHSINEVMSVYRFNKNSISSKKTGSFHTIKIIESLSIFNLYTDFRYNIFIQNRLNMYTLDLYKISLFNLPLWRKLLSPEYLLFKFLDIIHI